MISRNLFLYLLVSFLSFSSLIYCYSNEDFEGLLNIRLEHSLANTIEGEFVSRGNVTVHGGVSNINNLPLTQTDKTNIQLLAKEDKFYRLKAYVINNDGTETMFLTSIKACMLGQSGLNDYLSVSLDHNNNVVGISIGVQPSIPCQGANIGIEKLFKFNTKIFITSVTNGPIPDTATYIQKLEREREAKERGETKDNRSFLAKYWMYIVPVVLIMVLSSAANPDGAGGVVGARQG